MATALALASAAMAGPKFIAHPTPAQIDASLARYGARSTVSALFDQNRWDYVADRISAGSSDWVNLAGKLAPGADAGPAEELPISLAFALPRNAPAVLALVRSGAFSADDVCGVPFIEGTIRDIGAYKRRAAAAIRRVSDPALAATVRTCLATLAKSP